MSFGDGIASVCAKVERRHGAFWANVVFIGILGSVIFLGVSLAVLLGEYWDWDIGQKNPEQAPCNVPHVCDTFHGFLEYRAKDFWNNDEELVIPMTKYWLCALLAITRQFARRMF